MDATTIRPSLSGASTDYIVRVNGLPIWTINLVHYVYHKSNIMLVLFPLRLIAITYDFCHIINNSEISLLVYYHVHII